MDSISRDHLMKSSIALDHAATSPLYNSHISTPILLRQSLLGRRQLLSDISYRSFLLFSLNRTSTLISPVHFLTATRALLGGTLRHSRATLVNVMILFAVEMLKGYLLGFLHMGPRLI